MLNNSAQEDVLLRNTESVAFSILFCMNSYLVSVHVAYFTCR